MIEAINRLRCLFGHDWEHGEWVEHPLPNRNTELRLSECRRCPTSMSEERPLGVES